MKTVIMEGRTSDVEERKQPCIYIELGDLSYEEADEVDIGKIVAVTIVGKLTAKTQRKDAYGRSATLTIEPSEITARGMSRKSVFTELSEDED
jgi:hypothetical protein